MILRGTMLAGRILAKAKDVRQRKAYWRKYDHEKAARYLSAENCLVRAFGQQCLTISELERWVRC